jgi:hypothetical protein
MLPIVTTLAAALAQLVLTVVPPAKYAGDWTLDRAQSRGLPPYYENVRSHRLAITQSDSILDVFVTGDAGAATPDTIRFRYRLDGQTTETRTAVRTPAGLQQVPTALAATPTANGGVHIVITRTVAMGGPPARAVSTEDWSLGADQRTLTVHRVDEMPRGRIEADMVFRRDPSR